MNLREQLEKEITEKVMIKLAKHEVELAVIDDLKKVVTDYIKSNANYQTVYKEHALLDDKFMALKAKAREYYALDKKVYADAQKVIANVTKQAKDLGIDPNSIPSLKDLYKLIDESSRSYKTYEAIEKY